MSGFSRHRRSGASVATFTVFEADLLRSLAAQLIELLRNESATTVVDARPAGGAARLLRARPPRPTTRCSRGCSRRRTPTTRRRPATSGASPRAPCATARPAPRPRSSTRSRRPACPPEPEDGLFIDVELDQAAAMTWMRSLHRHAPGHRHPARRRGGRRGLLASLPDDDPRAQVHDIYDWLGYLQETLVQPPAERLTGRQTSAACVSRPGARRRPAQPPMDGRGAADACALYPGCRRARPSTRRSATRSSRTRSGTTPTRRAGSSPGPRAATGPSGSWRWSTRPGQPTFYEFDSGELLALYKEMMGQRRGAGGDLPLAHRDRGLPEPHRHRPGQRARRPLRAGQHTRARE